MCGRMPTPGPPAWWSARSDTRRPASRPRSAGWSPTHPGGCRWTSPAGRSFPRAAATCAASACGWWAARWCSSPDPAAPWAGSSSMSRIPTTSICTTRRASRSSHSPSGIGATVACGCRTRSVSPGSSPARPAGRTPSTRRWRRERRARSISARPYRCGCSTTPPTSTRRERSPSLPTLTDGMTSWPPRSASPPPRRPTRSSPTSTSGPEASQRRILRHDQRRATMTDITAAGVFTLGDRTVGRMGYGAMQLAGPGVFGPPKDHDAAIAVLRAAVAAGVDHIDTSDFYGPHVTNQLIREALHPYPDGLTIVTKVGGKRGPDASWNPAQTPPELTQAVHDNLRNLAIDAVDVVNLRVMGAGMAPSEASIAERFGALAELRRQGLIRHLGLSNATAAQVEEARTIAPVVCVQN